MGYRGEMFSTRVTCEGRTYFFNVKQNRMGDVFLSIVESKPTENNYFERRSIIIFGTDMKPFLQAFRGALDFMEKTGNSVPPLVYDPDRQESDDGYRPRSDAGRPGPGRDDRGPDYRDRPYRDRPEGDSSGYRGDRGYRDRNYGDRPYRDRPYQDRPYQDRGPSDRGPVDRGPSDRGPVDRGPGERRYGWRGDQSPQSPGSPAGSLDPASGPRVEEDRGFGDAGAAQEPERRRRFVLRRPRPGEEPESGDANPAALPENEDHAGEPGESSQD